MGVASLIRAESEEDCRRGYEPGRRGSGVGRTWINRRDTSVAGQRVLVMLSCLGSDLGHEKKEGIGLAAIASARRRDDQPRGSQSSFVVSS
jgi:hypothetical protein